MLTSSPALCGPSLAPFLTFSVFARIAAHSHSGLTIAKAFTSLSLFALLNPPLGKFLVSLSYISGAVTSFGRIQAYLNAAERIGKRMAVVGQQQAFGESTGSVELQYLRERDTAASVTGTFSWPEADRPLLNIPSWHIQQGAFTIVLGAVGCGKSTLLKALLGELTAFEGTIRISSSDIAYCGQTPWLPNGTVKEIIVAHSSFNETWYSRVVEACALGPDIASWVKGDQSRVGSKGLLLSGGQKQRLVSMLCEANARYQN